MSARKSFPLIMAGLLLFVGTAIFFVAAQMVARDDWQRSRQSLATTSSEIASTLELAIQHEQDLAVSAGAFAIGLFRRLHDRGCNCRRALTRRPSCL